METEEAAVLGAYSGSSGSGLTWDINTNGLKVFVPKAKLKACKKMLKKPKLSGKAKIKKG